MLTPDEILNAIDEYNLTIRRIPKKVKSSYRFPFNDKKSENSYRSLGYQITDKGIYKVAVKITVPVYAGCYMAKRCYDTSSSIIWSRRVDGLFEKLSDAVENAIKD